MTAPHQTNAPDPTPWVKTVASVGTAAGMLGVGHALYRTLADPKASGLDGWALAEAGFLATFLEGVVLTSALRAQAEADAGRSAGFDITVVLVAGAASGVVSGLSADSAPGAIFRTVVPILAALVWLGDVLRRQRQASTGRTGPLGLLWQRALVRLGLADHGQDVRELDRERLLRKVIQTVTDLARARAAYGHRERFRWYEVRARGSISRADDAKAAALARFEEAGGDRRLLADRLNAFHHRGDLDAPLAPSQWQALATEQEANRVGALLEERRAELVELTGQIEAGRRATDQVRAEAGRAQELAERITDRQQRIETQGRELAALESRLESVRRESAGRIEEAQRAADRICREAEQHAARVFEVACSLPPSGAQVWNQALDIANEHRAAGEPLGPYQLRKRLGLTSGSTADRLIEALAKVGFTTTVEHANGTSA